MGRRWTTNQYMDRYERRLERRAFNKMWDNVHRPPSQDGSRRCADCAKNAACTLNRRCNHGACFVAVEKACAVEEPKTPAAAKIFIVIVAAVLIGLWIALASWNLTVALIVILVLIVFFI